MDRSSQSGLFTKCDVTFVHINVSQATNEVITRVPKSTNAEMEAAVEAAKAAFKPWSETSILTRQQTMFKFQHLIKENMVR